MLFVSSDGYALEGPSASLVARFGDRFVTPRTDQGILEGTTQAAVFESAGLGPRPRTRCCPLARVAAADALWLLSSGRQIAPVSDLDGQPFAIDHELTTTLVEALWARRD